MTSSPSLLLVAVAVVLAETALLLSLVKLVDRYAPFRWVRERHDLALVAVALVPLLMAMTLLPAQEHGKPLLGSAAIDAEAINSAPIAVDRAISAHGQRTSAPGEAEDRTVQRVRTSLVPSNSVVLLIWTIGTLAMVIRLVNDARALARLRGRSEPIGSTGSLGLTKDLEVRASGEIISPMLAGFRQPCILVPAHFTLSTQAAPVLEHEIAHARRGDNWITMAQRLVTAAFWWNVPLHYLAPVIARTRESLCDHDAAVATGAPKRLAHALLEAAAMSAQMSTSPSPRLAAHAHGVALEERVRHLRRSDAAQVRKPCATVRIILPTMATAAYLLAPSLGGAAPEDADEDERRIGASLERLNQRVFGTGASLLLYEAAEAGNATEVGAMLDRGVDPSAPALGDGTPLMGAIRGGHLALVRTLLAAGADPNVTSPGDGTALIAAARRGDRVALELLLDAGATPDLTVAGDGAALISAAARNDLTIIDALLAAGADPNVAIGGDGTPLIAAALRGNAAAAERLLAAGADANGYVLGDETPLINAAQQGHLEIGKLLVAQGADVSKTVRTARGAWRSPLSEARDRDHPEFQAWLETLGATHQPGRD
ncbi:MAG: ankyrin repeat domain-containing protein [Pseudomonadota bacterium]